MTIRSKVLTAFCVPTVVTLVVSVVTLWTLTQSQDATDRVRQTELVIDDANQLIKSAVDTETAVRGFVIVRAEPFLDPYTRGNSAFITMAAQLEGLLTGDSLEAARMQQAVRLHQRWIDETGAPEIAATRAGDPLTATRIVQEDRGKALVDQLRAVVDDLIGTEQNLLRARIAESDVLSGVARSVLIGGFAFLVLLELAIGYRLSRGLSESARAVTQAARQLAGGDTTVRAQVRSRDEIGDLTVTVNRMADRLVEATQTERASKEALRDAVRDYSEFATRVAAGDLTTTVTTDGAQDLDDLSRHLNGMVRGLADIAGEVRAGVQRIGTSTAEILAAVSQHTVSASQQSAALTQTSTTVDEIRAASEQTARAARTVAEQATDSVQVSDEGTRAVETITRAMEDIRDRVETMARDILALSQQTLQIGEITATVNDLADQSNILALNASIEAAKAGEEGRGFAVVASEVRNLAEQSKAATSQVRRILGDVQRATTAAVLATEQGTKVVERGLELSGRAGDRIRSLAETILDASHAAQQIAASANQQSIGIEQIAQALQEMSDSAAQFVAGSRQSQEAAEDLNALAQDLAALTDRYRLSEDDHGAAELRRHRGTAHGDLLGRGPGAPSGDDPAPARTGAGASD